MKKCTDSKQSIAFVLLVIVATFCSPIVASSALSPLALDAVDIVALVMSHHKKMQSKVPAPAKACCISLRPSPPWHIA